MMSHRTYEILEEIGRGSLATVYRARDLALKRYVAIKELHEKFKSDPRQMEQFWEEAQFLANLKHDNIVQVHGLDKERGWIIMELLKGSLDANLAENPLPADLVRSVLRQTLSALKALHELRKFHGAVKPANLLIDEHGRVKLSDSAGVTLGGEIRRPSGSSKYLAPEMLNPEFGEVGTQVDLYCLGLTALELLKGTSFDKLFKGVTGGAGDPELAWMRWHSSPTEVLPPVKDLMPSVPSDLAQVIDKLLKKHTAERYASAAEALKDLEDKPIVLVEPAKAAKSGQPALAGPAVVPLGAVPPTPAAPRPPAGPPKHVQPASRGSGKPGKGAGLGIQWFKTHLFNPQWLKAEVKKPRGLACVLGGMLLLFLLIMCLMPGPSGKGLEMTVETDPAGASVRLNGADLEKPTPGPVALLSGENKLWLKAPGYEDKKLLVTVKADEILIQDVDANTKETISRSGPKVPIKVLMAPSPGTDVTTNLTVTSEPTGAMVSVGGMLQAQATDNTYKVKINPTGKTDVQVKVEMGGYEPAMQMVQLARGTDEKVHFKLTEVPMRQLAIKTVPPEATVFVNGEKVKDKLTDGDFQVPGGKFLLKLQRDGYLSELLSIEPSSGPVEVALTKIPQGKREMYIASKPPGATVFISNVEQPKKTDNYYLVPVGPFDLRLEKPGFVTANSKVGPDDTKKLEILVAIGPGTRLLVIASSPTKAKVFIDGTLVEDQLTDDSFVVPDRPFKLKAERPGMVGIKLVGKDETRVDLTLQAVTPGKHFVWIGTTPEGAEVYIDKVKQKDKTNNYYEVPDGEYELTLTWDGKSPITKIIDPKTWPGYDKKGIRIEESSGATFSTLIATNPNKAKIYINGQYKGEGGSVFVLPDKKFKLRAELEGYFPFEQDMEPTKEKKLNINLDRAVRVAIQTDPPGAAVQLGKQDVKDPLKLVLRPGKYEVTAQKDGFESKTITIVLAQTDEQKEFPIVLAPLVASKHALLVGVRGPNKQLPEFVHAGADIEELGRVLRAGGFDAAKVSVLTQNAAKPPTAKQLREELARLVKTCTGGDTLLVAFAGHTVLLGNGKEVYFCPAGADFSDKETLLPLSVLFQELQKCKARTKLVLLDLWRADVATDSPALPPGVKLALPGDVDIVDQLAILASCSGVDGGHEYLGPFQRHGVFFQFVIRGLFGAAVGENDQQVTLPKLVEYVTSAVPKYVEKDVKCSQRPRFLDGRKAPVKDLVLVDRKGILEAVNHGLVLLEGYKFKKALDAFNQAVKESNDFVQLYTLRAATNYILAEREPALYKRALDDCLAALKLDPNHAQANSFAGEAYLQLAERALWKKEAPDKAYEEALRYHDKEIELEPGCSLGYDNRGLVHESRGLLQGKAGELDAALKYFELAITKQPLRSMHHSHHGRVLKVLEKFGPAIADFDKAIELDPQNSELYYHRGWCKYYSDNAEKAIVDLDMAIQLDMAIPLEKRSPAYWNLRGLCRAKKAEYDSAIDNYSEAFRVISVHVKLNGGKVEGDQARAPEAAKILVNRGVANHEKGQLKDDKALYQKAIADFNLALKFNPNSFRAYRERGKVYRSLGNPTQAEADEQMALKLEKQ
jgi:tetratricopeptide (TPR) repeat protein